MKRLRDRVAGLDVHRDTVVACARVVEDGSVRVERARFKTTSAGLGALAEWLAGFEVTTVGMEATGIYWRPVFYVLEGRFPEVWLCNAQHVKNVPGRKTDMADAEWLADVVAHGMVRPSMVPGSEVRAVRELVRYRRQQVRTRASEIQRLERLLQDAGIKLSSVASKTWSKSSVAMVEALIAGERDPAVLAELAQSRLRSKIPELTEALAGSFGSQHQTLARQILDHVRFLDGTIATLDTEIVEGCAPFETAITLLDEIPGVGRRVSEVVIAETGANMAVFPTAGHFASWTGLSPGNHESAGKRRQVGVGHGNPYLRDAFIEAAWAAARTDSFLAARFRRLARRKGKTRAAVAVAHSIAVIVWNVLSSGERYTELGADFYERRVDPRLEAQRHIRRLNELGFHLELPAA